MDGRARDGDLTTSRSMSQVAPSFCPAKHRRAYGAAAAGHTPLRPTAPARRRRRTTRASSRYRSANIGSERCIATAVPSYTSFFVDSSIESPAPIRMIHI